MELEYLFASPAIVSAISSSCTISTYWPYTAETVDAGTFRFVCFTSRLIPEISSFPFSFVPIDTASFFDTLIFLPLNFSY